LPKRRRPLRQPRLLRHQAWRHLPACHLWQCAELSPVNAIAKIKAPLMLIHGKRDVTVDHVQSQKMFNAMTKADKAVEFVSLPLADHYFTREADRIKLLSSMEAFLAKHNPAS
jgi:dipeptidyl aminopeptidase/acylaminoacyl peptidase